MLPDNLGGMMHISVRGSFLDADFPATGSKLHACSHGWACTGEGWKIRHELNYAWIVEPQEIADTLGQRGNRQ